MSDEKLKAFLTKNCTVPTRCVNEWSEILNKIEDEKPSLLFWSKFKLRQVGISLASIFVFTIVGTNIYKNYQYEANLARMKKVESFLEDDLYSSDFEEQYSWVAQF